LDTHAKRKRSNRILIAAALALAAVCAAQRGLRRRRLAGADPAARTVEGDGARRAPSGPKLADPQAFPLPGTYPTTESVFLYSDDPGVQIHYTFDGSNPTAASPVLTRINSYSSRAFMTRTRGLRAGYTIRAMAMKEGAANSNVATFPLHD